ncbi:trans-aconitate methyltransferase [Streptomyces sp. enrichment culture]|uniref:trans-aconitate methyltransferase n=1 Tax=Streptomyces sp. enrichment culture TaxID=1795815 RepID=UPI003F54C0DE
MNRSTAPTGAVAGAAAGAASGAHTGTAVPGRRGPQDAPEPRPGPPVPAPATVSSGDVIPGAGPTGRPAHDRPAHDGAAQAAGTARPAVESPTDRDGQPAAERATLRLRETPEPEPEPEPGPEPEPEPEHGSTDRGPRNTADEPPRYAPEWLRLREPADASARAHDLLDPLRIRLANRPTRSGGLVVHDVGCGTGSMGRWLAPLLDGAQHWVLHDRDPYLLHFAAVAAPRSAADGSRVTVETRRADLARLTPDALTGAGLVTASALLDVLTAEEVGNLAAACARAGCPALLTLSVAGRVDLTPVHPLDAEITEAFNAHQRREGLLGPEAVTAAADAFAAHGATVHAHPSPWRLGPDEAGLTAQWLRGWVGAAVEQRPELHERAERYLYERLAICAAGELRVVVHHTDLLALCRPAGGTP